MSFANPEKLQPDLQRLNAVVMFRFSDLPDGISLSTAVVGLNAPRELDAAIDLTKHRVRAGLDKVDAATAELRQVTDATAAKVEEAQKLTQESTDLEAARTAVEAIGEDLDAANNTNDANLAAVHRHKAGLNHIQSVGNERLVLTRTQDRIGYLALPAAGAVGYAWDEVLGTNRASEAEVGQPAPSGWEAVWNEPASPQDVMGILALGGALLATIRGTRKARAYLTARHHMKKAGMDLPEV